MKGIPVAAPDLSGNEEAYVVDALRSSWISSTGAYVDRFEETFAELCGTTSALGICNGTAALHLALLTLNVRPGDEVIVPAMTYVATANAVRYVGAEPIFVDCDPETWCLDPVQVEAAITRRTTGIIPVHLLGHPCDMDAINRIAAVHGLWVVEDAAEAHLAKYKGRPVGGLAKMATFSFFGNKVFTCGEGGAVTLSDPQLATRMRILRGQGMDPERRYFFPVTGYNYRLTNLACAILCAQLERRDAIVERRRAIFALYQQMLGELPGISFQQVAPWAEVAPWLFSMTVDPDLFGATRDEVASSLAAEKIETRPLFIPLHHLPPFREESRRRGEEMPVSDRLGETGLMLPTYNQMTDSDVERIAGAIARVRSEPRSVLRAQLGVASVHRPHFAVDRGRVGPGVPGNRS